MMKNRGPLKNSICIEREFRLNYIEWAIRKPNSASGRSYYYVGDRDEPITDPLRELREKAYDAAKDQLEAKVTDAIRRERSEVIKTYALYRSEGVCEGCDNPAPYIARNGILFLEVHHIYPISDGGADHPRNVAALCPNCHGRIEYGVDGTGFNELAKTEIIEKEDNLDKLYE